MKMDELEIGYMYKYFMEGKILNESELYKCPVSFNNEIILYLGNSTLGHATNYYKFLFNKKIVYLTYFSKDRFVQVI